MKENNYLHVKRLHRRQPPRALSDVKESCDTEWVVYLRGQRASDINKQ